MDDASSNTNTATPIETTIPQASQPNANPQVIQPVTQTNQLPMIITSIIAIIGVAGSLFFGYKYFTSNTPPSPSNTLPETVMPNTIPSDTVAPETITPQKMQTTTKLLKVTSMGGGADGGRIDYSFTFPTEAGDLSTIKKKDLKEIQNTSGLAQGAVDEGLEIKHNATTLTITPSFEGNGSFPLKNKNKTILTNNALTDSPIYRISYKDFSSVAMYAKPPVGSIYTIGYEDNPKNCNENSPSDPACMRNIGVVLKDDHDLTITCSATDQSVEWCDMIVKNMSVSVKKY